MKMRYFSPIILLIIFVHNSHQQNFNPLASLSSVGGLLRNGSTDSTETVNSNGSTNSNGLVNTIRNTTSNLFSRLETPRDRVIEFIKPAVKSDLSRNITNVLNSIWNRLQGSNISLIQNPYVRTSIVRPINITLERLTQITAAEDEHAELNESNLEIINLDTPEEEQQFREYLTSSASTETWIELNKGSIKLIKKRSRKRNSSKCSSKKNLKLSPSKLSNDSKSVKELPINSKQCNEIPIDQNESEEVELISYTNLDISLNNKLRSSSTLNQLDVGIEMKEEFNRLNSRTLESIKKEEENLQIINQLIIEKEQLMIKIESLNYNLNEEDLNDKILHELHVNSLNKLDIQQCTSNYHNNQFCTLATKHDELINDEEIIDTQPNDLINIANDKIEQMDICAPIEINELIEFDKLEVKLIDDTNTVDEVDALTTIHKLKQLKTSNEQLNQTINNQINSTTTLIHQQSHQTNLNDSIQTTKQLNQDQSNNQLEIDEKRKINKKLTQPDTDLRTNAILNGKETWIELNKGSNCAIGIDLIERTINDETLFIIHEICEKGIAETDQRLKVGDLILMVNDIHLKNMNCEEALDHLNRTSGSVKLLIYRELICVSSTNEQNENNQNQLNNLSSLSNNRSSNSLNNLKINYSLKSTMQENECNDNIEKKIINDKLYEIIDVDLQKKTTKGLGLCIVSDNGKSPGPFISEILPNSIAFMEGRLKKGDHIIYINGEDVTNQSITTTIAMLKCLQGLIKIKVARLMPGQIVSLESFNRNQPIEPIQINFRVLVIKPIIKNQHLTAIKPKQPINDRVRELQNKTIKDSDSIISELSILNETNLNETNLCNDNQDVSISTINKNWIKVDKEKADLYDDQLLNKQLELMNCQSIDELIRTNRILEIDGQQFNNQNKDELLNKLKRSTINIQMIILE